ncbi:hypothetical protein V3C99_009988, partial [Haemonchus contortus]|uniref:peptidyl-tRNA hydrolase n=1 Tax=Haemonchus contortus TaxID=6289 RepID=A0A7I5EA87_HAECO
VISVRVKAYSAAADSAHPASLIYPLHSYLFRSICALSNMTSPSCYVMYLVLRRDLMSSLGWPMGAVCTQAAHAASAAMWLFRNDPNTEEYTKELDSMHKITLGVDSEDELIKVHERLKGREVDHKVWVEDGQSVCIALKPYPKEQVKNALKGLKLF